MKLLHDTPSLAWRRDNKTRAVYNARLDDKTSQHTRRGDRNAMHVGGKGDHTTVRIGAGLLGGIPRLAPAQAGTGT